MVRGNEVLRAHYRYGVGGKRRGHEINDIYVAHIDNTGFLDLDHPQTVAAEETTTQLAAQVLTVRDGRQVEGEYLGLSGLTDMLLENDMYVANSGADFHLSGVLGYCIMDAAAASTEIRVKEGAVRDLVPGGFAMPERTYARVTAGMFKPILEDYAPGGVANLDSVQFVVSSPHPSSHGLHTMGRIGLERIEGLGFKGNAAEVYAAIGDLGAQNMRPSNT